MLHVQHTLCYVGAMAVICDGTVTSAKEKRKWIHWPLVGGQSGEETKWAFPGAIPHFFGLACGCIISSGSFWMCLKTQIGVLVPTATEQLVKGALWWWACRVPGVSFLLCNIDGGRAETQNEKQTFRKAFQRMPVLPEGRDLFPLL